MWGWANSGNNNEKEEQKPFALFGVSHCGIISKKTNCASVWIYLGYITL